MAGYPAPKVGDKVPRYHGPECGGRLHAITTYSGNTVNCDKCDAKFEAESKFGNLVFTKVDL